MSLEVKPGDNMERLKRCGEVCVLGVVIVVVWVLFTIPTIVHFTPNEVQQNAFILFLHTVLCSFCSIG